MDYTPIVLKNKGIPVELAKVKSIGSDVYEREYDEVGEVLKETVFVRFTNNVIADIEEHWGGLEAWQQNLEKMPVSTLRQSLAFALKRNNTEVGEAMLEGQTVIYSNVVSVAWAIANGVDPTVAGKMLRQSALLAEENRRVLEQAMSVVEFPSDSPGDSGTPPGPKRAARTKSSGN
jgi:hypothetical protein